MVTAMKFLSHSRKNTPSFQTTTPWHKNRLVSFLKRLKSSEAKLLNQYDNVIKEQLDSGVVEVIDKHVEEVVPGTVHYIPHKEVLKEDRATTNSGKLRRGSHIIP